jgi:hypothetical protein
MNQISTLMKLLKKWKIAIKIISIFLGDMAEWNPVTRYVDQHLATITFSRRNLPRGSSYIYVDVIQADLPSCLS